jgi:hypothetical protein
MKSGVLEVGLLEAGEVADTVVVVQGFECELQSELGLASVVVQEAQQLTPGPWGLLGETYYTADLEYSVGSICSYSTYLCFVGSVAVGLWKGAG